MKKVYCDWINCPTHAEMHQRQDRDDTVFYCNDCDSCRVIISDDFENMVKASVIELETKPKTDLFEDQEATPIKKKNMDCTAIMTQKHDTWIVPPHWEFNPVRHLDEKPKKMFFELSNRRVTYNNKYHDYVSKRDYQKFGRGDFQNFIDHHYPNAYKEIDRCNTRADYYINVDHPDYSKICVATYQDTGDRMIFDMSEHAPAEKINKKPFKSHYGVPQVEAEADDYETQLELF